MTEVIDRIQMARPRRFRRYPAYKDSGVEWLGEIPVHWEVKRLKFLLQEALQYGANEPAELMDPDLPRYIRITDVGEDGRLREETFRSIPKDVARPYLLQDGDLLFARSGATVGKTFRFEPSWGRAAYAGYLIRARLKLQRWSSRFVQYFTKSTSYWDWLQTNFIQATIQNVSAERYANLGIALPELREQQEIVSLLDLETARIDGLVAKKERLIELLQEKRTALITRAVTRGLDPNAPMKDSGVEWLGEIPAHWEVKPLKSISDLQTGLTLGKRYKGEALTTRPYLRVANVQDGFLALDDIAEVEVPVRDVRRFELRMGDVLMTEGGDFDKLGRGHVWKEQLAQCLHQNHIFAVRPRRSALTSHFLARVMSSAYGRAYFTATSKQSTNLASTNSTKLRNLPIPLPGLDDQVEITRWTDRETSKIDALIAKIRQAIHHLKEFRTALISAAVTGKIDVRKEAS